MIEVLKQALDALETEVSIDWTNNDEFNASAEKMHDAITSLQQAIKELESQEPVGRFAKFTDGIWREVTDYSASVPLYTHPQRTWQGLTDEEREKHRDDWHSNIHDKEFKAIEAKLKQKNGFAEEKNT